MKSQPNKWGANLFITAKIKSKDFKFVAVSVPENNMVIGEISVYGL